MAKTTNPRGNALQALRSVERDKRTWEEAFALNPPPVEGADARFARALVLTGLRHWGQLDALIARYLDKPLPAKRAGVQWVLRLGAAQLLLLDTPAHAAVNETVALIARGPDAGFAGLVNAVLKKIAADKPALGDARANIPEWLFRRWVEAYGRDDTRVIATVAATRPPLDLNTTQAMEGTRLDGQILRLSADHPPVETLPGYGDGHFFVQDIAASYPARLLGDVRGKKLLDLCAAPGGKAMQLAMGGAEVTALDRSAARMERLRENIARLKLEVETVVANALDWAPGQAYDAVLLDAPCSATGTWRRHPEVLRIVSADDISELGELQKRLLARAWAWVKPGGRLVYCTCSLEPEEGEHQAQWFLETHADAALASVPPNAGIPDQCLRHGMLRTLPSHKAEAGGMDGFFAAAFDKQA